jgi:hypothetical protein
MTSPRPWIGLILTATLLCGAGCGGREFPPPPKTYPVNGKILSGSRPLSGGTLLCVLVTNNDKYGSPEAAAEVKPDGSFEPKLFTETPGLYPGVWKVVVRPTVVKNAKTVRIPESVPAKYTKEETTDLTFEVKEGENTPTLVVK